MLRAFYKVRGSMLMFFLTQLYGLDRAIGPNGYDDANHEVMFTERLEFAIQRHGEH